ncbi:hypothetical protein P3T76_015215 [Phytophthora citrophthora]|uniref:Uncharacterized protein n=1 Tax=Phytophthora citrophthora TaxID=4793 RepID=A0AAD9G0A1_9STRA|nr:hypothetical protein P3T76_015215 [Phytophthora citrophthora]
MQSTLGDYVETHSVERNPLVGERRSGISKLSTNKKVTETIDHVTQSVGQYQSVHQYLEKTVEDTPDRTSSEDEQRDHSVAVGLPPMVPAKMAAKASPMTEGVAAKEAVDMKQKKSKDQGSKVLEETRRRDVMRSPAVASEKSTSRKMNAKLGKTKMPKKVAAKSERRDRRRKRKTEKEKRATGISQASAKMLFQCSCQLLRTQVLDYDVRAREMQERNTTQVKEIEMWEKRIRSLQRELEGYSDEETDARPTETTRLVLIEAKSATASEATAQDPSALTPSAAASAEPSLPPAIAAAEAKLHEELQKRTQKLYEFCKSVPGFIDALDEHSSSPF